MTVCHYPFSRKFVHDNKDSKPPRLEAVQTQVVSKHSSQTLLTNGRTLIYLGSITSRRESAPSSAFHIEHSIPNYPGRPCSKIGPIERQTSPNDCRRKKSTAVGIPLTTPLIGLQVCSCARKRCDAPQHHHLQRTTYGGPKRMVAPSSVRSQAHKPSIPNGGDKHL